MNNPTKEQLVIKILSKMRKGESLTDCEEQYTNAVLACYDKWEKATDQCENDPDPELCRQKVDNALIDCLEAAYIQYLNCQQA